VRVVVAVAVALGGCSSHDCEGYLWHIHVAGATFDSLAVLAQSPGSGTDTILTPALIAAGQPAATGNEHFFYLGDPRPTWLGKTVSSYTVTDGDPFSSQGPWFVIAQLHAPDGSVASYFGASTAPDYKPADCGGKEADVTVALEAADELEVWGPPASTMVMMHCARVVSAGATDFYLEHAGDRDCDGLQGSADCQPYAYCDPADTSAAGMAACACP
jgi:hypothetical protein